MSICQCNTPINLFSLLSFSTSGNEVVESRENRGHRQPQTGVSREEQRAAKEINSFMSVFRNLCTDNTRSRDVRDGFMLQR